MSLRGLFYYFVAICREGNQIPAIVSATILSAKGGVKKLAEIPAPMHAKTKKRKKREGFIRSGAVFFFLSYVYSPNSKKINIKLMDDRSLI